jgi:quercetin 2,3-dioxygenase
MSLEINSVERGGPIEDRGVNHRARLAIAPERVAEHSPFLLMAEDWFAPPAGFPTHPHRGMETVTFVLEGELLHKDHTGGEGSLGAGDAQFMTAGGGVLHSEMPGPGGVRSLQLWLNLPARLKRTRAGYRDVRLGDAAHLRGDGTEARLYSGRLGGIAVPQATAWPMTLVDATLEPGATLALAVSAGERAFALVLEGETLLGANAQKVSAGEVAWAALPGEDTSLAASAPNARTRLLFYASPVIDEPVAMGGPFVMNTREEILEAFADLRAGRLTAPAETTPRFDFDQKAKVL